MSSFISVPCFTLLALSTLTIPVTAQSAGTAAAAPLLMAATSTPAFSSSSDSSSTAQPADSVAVEAAGSRHLGGSAQRIQPAPMRPFHGFAVAAAVSSGGIGADIATPLARGLELRVGGRLFGHHTTFDTDGINANADLTLQNVAASVDIYPFHNSFHISPGITLHNDNHVFSTLQAKTGQTFTLGDTDYTSSPTDPIRGTGRFNFGKTVAPRLTVGLGDMLQRRGGHVSFPTEIGFQYITDPTVNLTLTGTACSKYGCGPVNQGVSEQDIRAEEKKLENDLHPLRFYPIVSVGVAYRFGHQHGVE